MKRIALLLALTLSCSAFAQRITQYSCEVYENDVLSARQYVDGTKAFNESVDGKSFIIKDAKVYILDAKKKTATVLSLEDAAKTGGSQGMDLQITKWLGSETPIESATETKYLDPEEIDGILCKHYIAYTKTVQPGTVEGKTLIGTLDSDHEVWEHPEYGIPVQTLTGGSLKLNYRNIVPGPQPADKFEVPKGWEIKDMTEAFGALLKVLQNQ